MSKRLSIACSLFVACTTLCLVAAPVVSQELVRERLKSDVGIELLGKAILYSFYYQYTPVKQIGLEVGLGALGGGTGDDNTMLIFVPFGGKFYIIPKDGSLYLAGGGVFLNASTDSGPFDESGSTSYGYLGLGNRLPFSGKRVRAHRRWRLLHLAGTHGRLRILAAARFEKNDLH
jgi:hypothetical protein